MAVVFLNIRYNIQTFLPTLLLKFIHVCVGVMLQRLQLDVVQTSRYSFECFVSVIIICGYPSDSCFGLHLCSLSPHFEDIFYTFSLPHLSSKHSFYWKKFASVWRVKVYQDSQFPNHLKWGNCHSFSLQKNIFYSTTDWDNRIDLEFVWVLSKVWNEYCVRITRRKNKRAEIQYVLYF